MTAQTEQPAEFSTKVCDPEKGKQTSVQNPLWHFLASLVLAQSSLKLLKQNCPLLKKGC